MTFSFRWLYTMQFTLSMMKQSHQNSSIFNALLQRMQEEHGGNGCIEISGRQDSKVCIKIIVKPGFKMYVSSICMTQTNRQTLAVMYISSSSSSCQCFNKLDYVCKKSDCYENDNLVNNVPYNSCSKKTEAMDVSRLMIA